MDAMERPGTFEDKDAAGAGAGTGAATWRSWLFSHPNESQQHNDDPSSPSSQSFPSSFVKRGGGFLSAIMKDSNGEAEQEGAKGKQQEKKRQRNRRRSHRRANSGGPALSSSTSTGAGSSNGRAGNDIDSDSSSSGGSSAGTDSGSESERDSEMSPAAYEQAEMDAEALLWEAQVGPRACANVCVTAPPPHLRRFLQAEESGQRGEVAPMMQSMSRHADLCSSFISQMALISHEYRSAMRKLRKAVRFGSPSACLSLGKCV